MDDWHAHQYTNEQYYAWGGSAGGDKHYTWGALLCLIPIEQYMDETPWDGLRFGALNPPTLPESCQTLLWNHHNYKIAIGPEKTAVTRDGELRLEASAGVVVRRYTLDANRLTFAIRTPRPITVKTREYSGRSLSLRIDGQSAETVAVQEGSASFLFQPANTRLWKRGAARPESRGEGGSRIS